MLQDPYDFFLIESCWMGNDGDWIYAFTSPDLAHEHSQLLVSKLQYLRDNSNRPIVMINKEDPMHFEKFLPVMKYADHILTTDEAVVPLYRQKTPALTVTAIPFAANMTLTNPVGRVDESPEDVCFAGSYYGRGHEVRVSQMDYLLAPILAFKGVIYDRQSESRDPIYRFPERFAAHIRPSVSFREMTNIYRRFRVFLNVNTVTSSPTMMARRVYELLACGTPVVSAPSRAMEEQFSGIVALASTETEACSAVEKLLTDEHHWWKTSQKGIREIALKHQYAHRAALLRSVVWGEVVPDGRPLVSLLVTVSILPFLVRIVECIRAQTYPRMEVIFIINEDIDSEALERVVPRLDGIVQSVTFCRYPKQLPSTAILGAAFADARGEFFAILDDQDWYGPNYLTDMILTFAFSEAEIAGKSTYPALQGARGPLALTNPGNQHKLTSAVSRSTLVGRLTWAKQLLGSMYEKGVEIDFIRETLNAGGQVYSADHFNFVALQTGGSVFCSEVATATYQARLMPENVDHWVV